MFFPEKLCIKLLLVKLYFSISKFEKECVWEFKYIHQVLNKALSFKLIPQILNKYSKVVGMRD